MASALTTSVAEGTHNPSQHDESGSAEAEHLAQTDSKHRVSHVISAGRSGVQDVRRLLMRQPSVHPPMQGRTATLTPTPQHTTSAAQYMPQKGLVSGGLQEGPRSSLSLTVDCQPAQASAVDLSRSVGNAELQQTWSRCVSRLQQDTLQRPLSSQRSPSPSLQLSLSSAAAGRVSAKLDHENLVRPQPGDATASAADTNTELSAYQTCKDSDSQDGLPLQAKQVHSATTDTSVGAASGGVAANSLARVRYGRSSSGAGIQSSVSFLPAVQSSALDTEQSMSAKCNFQVGGNVVPMQSSSSSTRLARYSSTLAAAVGEIMQDRMTAGGMMQSTDKGILGIDRCVWIKADPIDTCPWPKRALQADRCSWPRSILQKPGMEPGNSRSSVDEHGSIAIGDAETATGSSAGKSMPAQLSKHRSNLNKVIQRADFAAAMDAVRESWVAQQQTAAKPLQASAESPEGADAVQQSSLDTVWQSISHHS